MRAVALRSLRPQVHVLVQGQIVKSGGKELALELEKEGYASWAGEEG